MPVDLTVKKKCPACLGKGWLKRPQLSLYLPHALTTVKRVCWKCDGDGTAGERVTLPLTAWRPRGICREPAKPTDGPVYANRWREPYVFELPSGTVAPSVPLMTQSYTDVQARADAEAYRVVEQIIKDNEKAATAVEKALPVSTSGAELAQEPSVTFGSLPIGYKFTPHPGGYANYTKIAQYQDQSGGEARWNASPDRPLKVKEMNYAFDATTPVYNVVPVLTEPKPKFDLYKYKFKTRPYVIIKGDDGVHYPITGPWSWHHDALIKDVKNGRPVSAGMCALIDREWCVQACENKLGLPCNAADDALIIDNFNKQLKSKVKRTKFDRNKVFEAVDKLNKSSGLADPKAPWNKGRKKTK